MASSVFGSVLRLWPDRADARGACRCLAQGMLLLVLVAAPWFFGGATAVAQFWLFSGLVVAALLTLGMALLGEVSREGESALRAMPTLLVPLVLLVLLGGLQLIPWRGDPPWATSPRRELLHNVGAGGTASICPGLTRLELIKVIYGVTTFVLSVVLFQTGAARLCLGVCLMLNGAVLAMFGIVQKLSWEGKLFWTVPVPTAQPFASFVNRNHAAGFLVISLSAGLGVLFWTLQRRTPARPPFAGAWLASLNGPQAFSGLACVLMLSGVVASLSRSGIAALILGLLILGLVSLRKTRSWQGLTVLVSLLLAATLVLAVAGVFGPLGSRLQNESLSENGRFRHWQDAIRAVPDFGGLGAGLGTYRYAYLPYQERVEPLWFLHADNQYLEMLVEGGWPGLGLAMGLIGLTVAVATRLIRSRNPGDDYSLACVAILLATAVPAQAVFDFGVTLPASFLSLAALWGSLSARAAHETASGLLFRLPVVGVGPFRMLLATVLVSSMVGWFDVSAAAEAESLVVRLPALESPGAVTPARLKSLIQDARRAVVCQPDIPEYRVRLSELLIFQYRQEVTAALLESEPGLDSHRAWSLSELPVLHRQANQAAREGDSAAIERLKSMPPVSRALRPALDHLLAARAVCPFLPRVDLQIACLSFLRDGTSGVPAIRRAIRVFPSDPEVCYTAGRLAEHAGEVDLAVTCWHQGLQLSSRRIPDALGWLNAGGEARAALSSRLLPEDPAPILEAFRKFAGPWHSAVRDAVLTHAEQQLDQSPDLTAGDRAYWRAVLFRQQGKMPDALRSYALALQHRPAELEWRLEYAQHLLASGAVDKAREQAIRLLRRAPRRPEFLRFHEELLGMHPSSTVP